jgi:hypothetical protein
MKKMKIFFAAAALTLVTAGVFAGRAKFADQGIYVSNGGSYVELSSTYSTIGLTTVGTEQALITDNSGVQYGVYTEVSSGVYTPLFAVSSNW